MNEIQFKRIHPAAKLPERKTAGASGWDVYAVEDVLVAHMPVPVPTGLIMAMPHGIDCQVRGRSGLAAEGVEIHAGTIDSDYRGQIVVMMRHVSPTGRRLIKAGDRVAQLVFTTLPLVLLRESEEVSDTDRGAAGFGSTGT